MSNLISKDGFEKLKAEWEHLKYTERPAVQQRVSDAAAEGDRSENAEYTYGRMRLREIDKRLRFLDKILDNAKIVENISSNDGSIRFGAKVSLQEIKTKKTKIYTLVGPQEIDPLQGKISISSPVGKVLIGKKQGDTVQVSVPKGILEYQIIEVSYK
ncbi:MAG: transcription elongation factor GreA [Fibrobacteraceae bacterium]|nr:transcription elongation factor GreA [Fibrobacteraceae bacterium]